MMDKPRQSYAMYLHHILLLDATPMQISYVTDNRTSLTENIDHCVDCGVR